MDWNQSWEELKILTSQRLSRKMRRSRIRKISWIINWRSWRLKLKLLLRWVRITLLWKRKILIIRLLFTWRQRNFLNCLQVSRVQLILWINARENFKKECKESILHHRLSKNAMLRQSRWTISTCFSSGDRNRRKASCRPWKNRRMPFVLKL